MHFDKFYSVKLDNNIIIDDIIEDMKSPLDFYSKYGYEIYCPDCKKAKLKYSSPSDRGNRKSFISAIYDSVALFFWFYIKCRFTTVFYNKKY